MISFAHESLLPPPTTLRLFYAQNRGSLMLLQLLTQRRYDLMDIMKVFLYRQPQFDLLFGPRSDVGDCIALSPRSFSYLLAWSLYATNLDWLDDEIKQISFVEIRRPDRQTNKMLHDMREHLTRVALGIAESIKSVSDELESPNIDQSKGPDEKSFVRNLPLKKLRQMLTECNELQQLLMETFQLLMSSLSVIDSQRSIEQARRSTLIAILAAVYVPLSFVTGIYGMNVKEINNSPLSVWVVFVTLGVVFMATAFGWAAWHFRHRLLYSFFNLLDAVRWMRGTLDFLSILGTLSTRTAEATLAPS